MRVIISLAAVTLASAALGGCATNQYASACERDYEQNRQRAAAAGAALGGIAGAAVAENDAQGAAIGAAAGGIIGYQMGSQDDPCGHGVSGYGAKR